MTARGNTRKTGLEQYYTPQETADALVRLVVDATGASARDHWLEPAAGTGAFTRAMRKAGARKVTSLDIDPKRKYVTKTDFLTADLPFDDGICVTNPPFGRNHSLSIPFFNHAAKHCRVIAFVVPRSWRKWSVVNRLDNRFHKVLDIDLDVSYVDEHGKPLSKTSILNTVFQVWVRRDDVRPKFPVTPPPPHVSVVGPEDADASLTVFGRGCGTVRVSFDRKPNTTQMFLKASTRVIAALKKTDLSVFYTQVAYTEALSLVEINYAVEHRLRTAGNLPEGFLRKSTLEA